MSAMRNVLRRLRAAVEGRARRDRVSIILASRRGEPTPFGEREDRPPGVYPDGGVAVVVYETDEQRDGLLEEARGRAPEAMVIRPEY